MESSPVPVSVTIDSCSVLGAARAGLAVAPVAAGAHGVITVINTTISHTSCAGLLVDSKAVESALLRSHYTCHMPCLARTHTEYRTSCCSHLYCMQHHFIMQQAHMPSVTRSYLTE